MTFRPRRLGVSHSQALAEAYASAPSNVIILNTLEFIHPSFIDSSGNQYSIRVVNDTVDLTAGLEPEAPLNPSEAVLFKAVSFKFTLPPESDSSEAPEIQISIDNVAKILDPYLSAATLSLEPCKVIWRPYTNTDLTVPHMKPVLTMTLRDVKSSLTWVTAKAGFADVANRKFARMAYTNRLYPGLTIR